MDTKNRAVTASRLPSTRQSMPTDTPHTSAVAELANVRGRLDEAHAALDQLEQAIGYTLAPVPPEGEASGKSDPQPPHSLLTEEARNIFAQVDYLCLRLTKLRMRVEL